MSTCSPVASVVTAFAAGVAKGAGVQRLCKAQGGYSSYSDRLQQDAKSCDKLFALETARDNDADFGSGKRKRRSRMSRCVTRCCVNAFTSSASSSLRTRCVARLRTIGPHYSTGQRASPGGDVEQDDLDRGHVSCILNDGDKAPDRIGRHITKRQDDGDGVHPGGDW